MRRLKTLIPFAAMFLAVDAGAGWFSSDDALVDRHKGAAIRAAEAEALNAPEICSVLSSETCRLLTGSLKYDITLPGLSRDDHNVIAELMQLTESDLSAGSSDIPDGRKAILRSAGFGLGMQMGKAIESARYNRLWDQYAHIYDRTFQFESLMVESQAGRVVVPPVISKTATQSVTSGGLVMRVADAVYRIEKQPRFSTQPPNWRKYLYLEISKPRTPASGLLPINETELDWWRTEVVRGYTKGIETVRSQVDSRYRELISDFSGMVMYHLLLEYRMVTPPQVEVNYSPVITNADGSVMAIDDTISVLTVEPIFATDRLRWKAYPMIKRLEDSMERYLDSLNVRGNI